MRVDPYDTDRQIVFSRRAALTGGVASLLFAGVGFRLYQLQVVEHEAYQTKSRENQFNQRVVPPLRGEILDRFGEPLATNRKNFRILLVPEQTKSVEESLTALSRLIELPNDKRNKILNEAARKRSFIPIEVEDNLSWEDFARVNLEGPHLPGVQPNAGDTREYPLKDIAALVVGYVGPVTDRDLSREEEAERLLLRQPGFRIGQKGVEKTFETKLRGAAGSMTVEVNAHGRVIDERPHEGNDPVQGETAVLTIDAELQAVAMKELEGESGAAVVMDVKTGEVLVMASSPAFDPNDFNVGINAQKWRELNASPYKPLLNKPLSGTYPPGSTFKMITAIAALEAGMSPNERINCSGRMYFGNRFFHCWKKEGHGPMNMRNAIKHSCDVYFYQAAIRAGVDRIASVSHRLGLGEIYPFDVPGQEKGIIPSTDWKLATLNERWYKGETLSVGIGQGYVNTNPMQLAVMTARLATGRAVKPWITRSLGAETFSPPEAPPIDIDPKHLAIVQGGMDAVTNEGGGTAWRSRLDNPDWRLAGKTGTSQVRRITKEERARGVIKNEDLPWHRRDHALFVAYAPYEDPRYAISVVVEHGGSGSKAAGPRAREIMKAVMAKDPARMKVVDPTGASGETAALPGDKARQG